MENNQVALTRLNDFSGTVLELNATSSHLTHLHQPFLPLSSTQHQDQCCNGSDCVVMRLLNWNDAAI